MRPIWGILAFIFSICAINGFCQPGIIKGHVVNAQTSRPIANAQLYIRGLPSLASTDSLGGFVLHHVPLSEVEVMAKKDGYTFIGIKANIKSPANNLTIKLEPAPLYNPPTAVKEMNRYREKVVVVTDKPYYYPREVIWFKAFMNFLTPSLKDSLSRVVHIELVGNDMKVMNRLMLSLDSGRLQGQIILPKNILPGSYMLRAYTNFMRNFGDDYFFYKVIPILPLEERVDPKNTTTHDLGAKITSDTERYGLRKKVTLSFDFEEGDYATSVTDATQVVDIPQNNLVDGWGFPVYSMKEPAVLNYVTEKGVRFIGKFLNENNTAKIAKLNFYRKDRVELFDIETDAKGLFQANGLLFFDSAQYFYNPMSIKSKKASRLFGEVQLQQEKPPPMKFTVPSFWFETINSKTSQRFLADYLVPDDVILLSEVEVQSNKLEAPEEKMAGILGGADKVIKGQELGFRGGNLLYSLQGQVPGLQIKVDDGCLIRFTRAMATTIVGTTEPLLLINNVPVGGSPCATLKALDPYTIERIEFQKRLNGAYGPQGANGIIAVYLKKGILLGDSYKDLLINKSITIKGFTRPLKFLSPDYSNPNQDASVADYRSTLYWNPELQKDTSTGKYSCSFYTSDLPGKYRIVVQGVTIGHKPVYAVKYIEVID